MASRPVFLVDYDAAAGSILLLGTTVKRRKEDVRTIAPAMACAARVGGRSRVPSQLAYELKAMGFEIVTWTFERTDLRQGAAKAGFYYGFDPNGEAIKTDRDMYKVLDVLAPEVGILGIFADWPATVSYYASCMKLK